jgi:hypothetical protein
METEFGEEIYQEGPDRGYEIPFKTYMRNLIDELPKPIRKLYSDFFNVANIELKIGLGYNGYNIAEKGTMKKLFSLDQKLQSLNSILDEQKFKLPNELNEYKSEIGLIMISYKN